MNNSSGELNLGKRDKLLLAIAALVEVDDRQPGRRNQINFSGSLFSSDNMNYLAEQCEQMAEWEENQLLEFAHLRLGELRNNEQ